MHYKIIYFIRILRVWAKRERQKLPLGAIYNLDFRTISGFLEQVWRVPGDSLTESSVYICFEKLENFLF